MSIVSWSVPVASNKYIGPVSKAVNSRERLSKYENIA